MVLMVDAYGTEAFNLADIECFRIESYSGDYRLLAIAKPEGSVDYRKKYVITIGDQQHCKDYLQSRLSQNIVLDTDR